jgi:hypothetical protein
MLIRSQYISCSLAHAALFLICAWKQGAKIDRGLVHHSLIQAIGMSIHSVQNPSLTWCRCRRLCRAKSYETSYSSWPTNSVSIGLAAGASAHPRSPGNLPSKRAFRISRPRLPMKILHAVLDRNCASSFPLLNAADPSYRHARSILNVDSDLQIPVEMDGNGHMGSWFPGDGGFSWQ